MNRTRTVHVARDSDVGGYQFQMSHNFICASSGQRHFLTRTLHEERSMSRIPKELQDVFVASNSGKEVYKPPRGGYAFKVFKKILKPLQNKGGVKNRDCSQSTVTASTRSFTVEDSIDDSMAPPEVATASLTTPHEFLVSELQARGYDTKKYSSLNSAHLNRPTPYQLASYDMKLDSVVVNQQNEEMLQELLECGLSPNACNIHGESLLHKTCRKGYHKLVEVFIDDNACLTVCDNHGRTLLHDTCWGTRPSFQVFNLLISRQPHLLLMADCRGTCPLQYIQKDHYVFWIDYLDRLLDKYWPPIDCSPTLPPSVTGLPNSNSIPDPHNALPLRLVSMLANGSMTPEEARIVLEEVDDDESEGAYSYSYDDTTCTSDDES